MNLRIVLGISLLCLTGCGTMILKHPQISEVKQLAIVSVYANTEIHEVGAQAGARIDLFKALAGNSNGKNNNIRTDPMTQIATYAFKTFGEELAGAGVWKIMPPKEMLTNARFNALGRTDHQSPLARFLAGLQKASDAARTTPPGMPLIPVSNVVEDSGSYVIIPGGSYSPEESRKQLAALCRELNVDAVALIGLDLAYKRGTFSNTGFLGGLLNVRGTATPVVGADIVMVTKDAKIALENLCNRGGVGCVETNAVPMLKNNEPSLDDAKGEAIKAYCSGIQKYALAIKARIREEYAK